NVADSAPEPAMVRLAHHQLWKAFELGPRPSVADLAGRGRYPGPDRVSLHRDSKGVLPGPGHRAHTGHFRSRPFGLVRGDGATATGFGCGHSQGLRCGEPVFLYWRRWD